MKRNGGIIKKEITSISLVNGTSGVFDLHDQFTNDYIWPKEPEIDTLTASGEVGGTTSYDVRLNWGVSTFTFKYTGANLNGRLYNVYWFNNNVNQTYTQNGSWSQLNIEPTSNTELNYTNGLKLQTSSQTGDSNIQVEVRIAGTSTVLFSHTVEIPDYTIYQNFLQPGGSAGLPTNPKSQFNEGETVTAQMILEGTSSLVASGQDIRMYNNWDTTDFTSDLTPFDYTGSFSSTYYATHWTFNMGTIRKDMVTESTETKTTSIRSWNGPTVGYSYFTPATTGLGYNQFQILDTSTNFTSTPSTTSQNEGATVTFTVGTGSTGDASQSFTYEIVGTGTNPVTSSDISSPASMGGGGSLNSSGQSTHTVTATKDFMPGGAKQYYVRYRNSVSAIIANSPTVTINDTATVSNVGYGGSTAEGDTFGMNLTLQFSDLSAGDGTLTKYWRTVADSNGSGTVYNIIDNDFQDGVQTGSFSVAYGGGFSNPDATINRKYTADGYTEGTEYYRLEIANSSSGPWFKLGPNARQPITDTSTGGTEPSAGLYTSKTDYSSSFVEISNRFIASNTYMGGNSDYTGPYDICDCSLDLSSTANRRVYLGIKITAATTFYNDIPIAGIQHLASDGTTLKNSWIWWSNTGGSGSSWQTTTSAIATVSTSGSFATISQATGASYVNIGSGSTVNRFNYATSTGSSSTGAAGGINSTYVTNIIPAPNGSATNAGAVSAQNGAVSQVGANYYAYIETSGATRYQCHVMRSPAVSFADGDILRIVHAVTGISTTQMDANNSIWLGVA